MKKEVVLKEEAGEGIKMDVQICNILFLTGLARNLQQFWHCLMDKFADSPVGGTKRNLGRYTPVTDKTVVFTLSADRRHVLCSVYSKDLEEADVCYTLGKCGMELNPSGKLIAYTMNLYRGNMSGSKLNSLYALSAYAETDPNEKTSEATHAYFSKEVGEGTKFIDKFNVRYDANEDSFVDTLGDIAVAIATDLYDTTAAQHQELSTSKKKGAKHGSNSHTRKSTRAS